MYESLTRFIPLVEGEDTYGVWFFDHEHAGTMEDPKQMPFVEYGRLAIDVEDAIYAFVDDHEEFGLRHYGDILERNGLKWGTESMEAADVSALDGRAVMALLVGAVRAERFCDGALLRFFQTGCIARWLRRLQELDDARDVQAPRV